MRDNNMASCVGGAALGPPLQMLFNIVIEVPLEKVLVFKDSLSKIKSTVQAMKPLIYQLEELNKALDLPRSEMEDFIHIMEEGQELVGKCTKYSKWKYVHKRLSFTPKLEKLDQDLDRLLKILNVQMARNVAEILNLTRDNTPGRTQIICDPAYKTQIEIKGWCEALEPPAFIVGLNKPLEELKSKLMSDDKRTVTIVVTAPPGCGKTTLARKLCKDDEIKGKFKSNIFFVTVSKNPNLNHIVHGLYQHKGYSVTSFQDNKDPVIKLERLLKEIGMKEIGMKETEKKAILLVLDDVWSGSESLINKFALPIPGLEYKILVTSRFPLTISEPPYELKPLRDEDAMAIFRYYASLEDGRLDIPNDLVKKVVDHCKRVPLALELIGTSLRGKLPRVWQRELEKWSTDSSILDFESELLPCLQSILDVLDEKHVILKECFMDLGLFPEDRRIPATALVDILKEVHGVKEDDAITKLYDLSDLSLAKLVVTRKDANELDDYYSEHFVTQHDMLRELSIHQSRQGSEEHSKRLIVELTENNLPKWWNEQKEQPFNASLLSISTDESFSSEWCDIQLPEAEVLVLNFRTKSHSLPKFVENMSKLKVLIITNYGLFPAELSNFQLLGSLTNLTRIRLERISIPSLKETSVLLKKLQKLSLFMCEIGQAFSSIKISEVFPNLEEINIDYCNDLEELPAGLCDLINLKKLSITHCHNLSALPEEIGNLFYLEVLRLRSCIDLEKLPDSICKLSKLTFLDLSDCFSIRNLPENIGELSGLIKLNMKNCSRLLELPPSVLDFKRLEFVVCDEELKEVWEFHLPADAANIKLKLAKDEVNLNWLENRLS